MKALTLHQPWASLIALGAKTIETRSWWTTYRGPLAIHAAVRPPRSADFGDSILAQHGWIGAFNLGFWAETIDHADPCDCDEDEEVVGERCMARSHPHFALLRDEGAHGFSLATTLPLGAIVATCTLVDVVPMVEYDAPTPRHGPLDSLDVPSCLDVEQDRLTYWWHHDAGFRDVTDQRPYGDFTPGRYAWLLDDVKPTTERCPACWGTRCSCRHRNPSLAESTHALHHVCSTCSGAGGCDPVPARGRQQLWEWTP